MDIVKLAISKPVSVAVGVILLIMFGLIGLTAIPIQLTPTVDRPIITVSTTWPGRSPQEVVDEITKNQEEELKNVSNLRKMISVSSEGTSDITLEFNLGADISQRLTELTVEAVGQATLAPPEPASEVHPAPREGAMAFTRYFNLRASSIAGGTNEVQKNIIAKLVLGL